MYLRVTKVVLVAFTLAGASAFADEHADHLAAATTAPSAPMQSAPGAMTDQTMDMMHMPMMMMDHMMHMAPHVQSDEKAETLFSSGEHTHGFFVAPGLKYTRIVGDDVLMGGARAAWILDHTLALGLAGYYSFNNVPAPANLQPTGTYRRYLSFGYGGLLLEYIIGSNHLFHGKVGTILGGGATGGMHHMQCCGRSYNGQYYNDQVASVGFFAAEPEVDLEVNLSKYARLNIGGGYRFVGGANGGLDNADLRGPTASAHIALGVF